MGTVCSQYHRGRCIELALQSFGEYEGFAVVEVESLCLQRLWDFRPRQCHVYATGGGGLGGGGGAAGFESIPA